MKNAVWKDFFRDIKKNKGRFLSIFCIVMLGTAFFAGLRSTGYDMKYSADRYYDDTRLMDIRVISTLGLSEEDIEDLRQIEGVSLAAGGKTKDVILQTEDASLVIRTIAMTDGVNDPVTAEGRLPSASGECFVDMNVFPDRGYKVGDTITFLSGDGEELSESLTSDTFTIVGMGYLPYYTDLTRGTGQIGDGSVDAFVLLDPDAYAIDYYTEAYLMVDGAAKEMTFSSRYDELVDAVSDRVDELAGTAVVRRYEAVKREAEDSIADAKQQVEDGEKELADAEKELADGWAEISDAQAEIADKEKELADGKKELQDAEQEISDAWQEVNDGWAAIFDAQAQTEAGKAELDQARAELAAGQKAYEEGLAQYEENRKKLQDAEAEIEAKTAELSAGEKQYEEGLAQYREGAAAAKEGRKQYEAGRKAYEEGKAQYDEGLAQYEEGLAQYEELTSQYEAGKAQYEEGLAQTQAGRAALEAGRAEYAAGKAALDDGLARYSAGIAQLQTQEAEYQAGKAAMEQLSAQLERLQAERAAGEEIMTEEELAALDRQIAEVSAALEQASAGVAAYESAFAELQATKAMLDQQEAALAQAKAEMDSQETLLAEAEAMLQEKAGELAEAEAGLQVMKAALDEAKQALDEKAPEIEAARKQLEDSDAELTAAEEELAAGKKVLDENAAQIASGRQQLAAAKTLLESGKAELEKGKKTLEDSRKQLADGAAQIAAGEQELSAGLAEISANISRLQDAEKQLEDSGKELDEARKTIADGEQQLADGKEELADGIQELEDAQKEFDEAAPDARREIEEAKQKIADGESELEKLEVPEWYVLDRSLTESIIGYDQNADRMNSLGQVFPVIFFLVAALVSLTAMTRMVDEQRVQIGTMKALGYSGRVIAGRYVWYALLATTGGSLIGIAFGEWFLPRLIIQSYGIMYTGMLYCFTPPNWDQAALGLFAALFCTVGASLAASIGQLRSGPAALMRPEAPKSGQRVLLERLGRVWTRLGFSMKSTIRNLVRYKKRLVMTIIGVGGCMGLLLVGFGLHDSINEIAKRQYIAIFTQEASVTVDSAASAAEKDELNEAIAGWSGVTGTEKVCLESADLMANDKIRNAFLYVPEDPAQIDDYLELRDRGSHEQYAFPREGAVIAEKTANMLGLSVGDEVSITRDGEKTVRVRIHAIAENYVLHYLFLSADTYRELYGKDPEYNSIYINYEEMTKEEESRFGSFLMKQPACAGISFVTDLEENIEDMLSILGNIVLVLIVAAGLLAFVVLYNLNSINIMERRRELATLKVLGFYDSEVAMYVYRENIILTVLGCIFGLLFGTILHRFTIVTVEVDLMMFGRNILPSSYLISVLITFGFAFIVNIAMFYSLKKVDMIESLKSVE